MHSKKLIQKATMTAMKQAENSELLSRHGCVAVNTNRKSPKYGEIKYAYNKSEGSPGWHEKGVQ